ncbi:N-acetylmuramoyl-L-alanine amidase [bacterium]|nr:N-acetylmuramoyl-L-alanine amidase [bacterium]
MTETVNENILLTVTSSDAIPYEVQYTNEFLQISFPLSEANQFQFGNMARELSPILLPGENNKGFFVTLSLDQFHFVSMRPTSSLQNLQWSFSQTYPMPLAGKTIILDPGHGAYDEETMSIYDTGVLKFDLIESELNLRVAFALKPLLEEMGATVILTREKEKYTGTILFKPRIEFVNTIKPDIYLAIHHNDSDYEEPNGIFVYYNHPDSEAFANFLFHDVSNAVGLKKNHVLTDPLVTLSSLNVPTAALIECSFFSSVIDRKILSKPDYVVKVSEGIKNAILHNEEIQEETR